MTRPVRPRSPMDEVRGARKGVESLAKRPAPVVNATADPVEWIYATSGTDLGTTYTVLDFASIDRDDDGTTFAVNVAQNVTISKDGYYTMHLWETGIVKQAGVTTISIIRARSVSGETPKTLGYATFATGMEVLVPRRIDSATGAIDASFSPTGPDWILPLAFPNGTFPGTGACEIEIACYHEEDRVGVATTAPTMHLWLARIGSSYLPA